MLVGLAQYLHGQGVVTFDMAGTGGDCFIGTLPPSPDEAVALVLTQGRRPSDRLGYDAPAVQVLVRATTEPQAHARALAIYHALHGARFYTLGDGTFVLWSSAVHYPRWWEQDRNGRVVYVTTFDFEIRATGGPRE